MPIIPRAHVDSGVPIGNHHHHHRPDGDADTATASSLATASTIPQVPSTPLALMGRRYFSIRTLGEGSFGEVFLVEDRGDPNGSPSSANTTLESFTDSTSATMTGGGTFTSSSFVSSGSAPSQQGARRQCYPLYVVKRLKQPFDRMAKREVDEARAEIASISKLSHPNVVGFHRAWFDAKDYRLHMLLEYCEEGDLHEFVKRNYPLSEDLLRSLMVQMMAGLAYIHSQRTMHRDIKLQNVFVTSHKVAQPDGRGGFISSRPLIDLDHRSIQHIVSDDDGYARIVKIGDFGLSKSLVKTEECAKTTAGTPFHFSPELARRAPYSSKNDVWSMGIAFYYLLTNSMPFQGRTIPEVVRAVISQDLPPPSQRYMQLYRQPMPYSGLCQQLVTGMLRKDPAQRPSASEVLDLAPFFVGVEESRRRRAARVNAVRAQQMLQACGEPKVTHSSEKGLPPQPPQNKRKPSPQPEPLHAKGEEHNKQRNTSRTPMPPLASKPPSTASPKYLQLRFVYNEALVAVRVAPFHGTESVGTLRCGDVVSVEAAVSHRRGALEPVLYGEPTVGSHQPAVERTRWYRLVSPLEGFCIAYLPAITDGGSAPVSRRPSGGQHAAAVRSRALFQHMDSSPSRKPSPRVPNRHGNDESSDCDGDVSDDPAEDTQVHRLCVMPPTLLENPDDFLSRISVLMPNSDEEGDDDAFYSKVEGVFVNKAFRRRDVSLSDDTEETDSSDDELVIVDGAGERIYHPDSKFNRKGDPVPPGSAMCNQAPCVHPQADYEFVGGGAGRVVRAGSDAQVGVAKQPSPVSPTTRHQQTPSHDGSTPPRSRHTHFADTAQGGHHKHPGYNATARPSHQSTPQQPPKKG